jgi:hypothetical protein
MTDDLLFLEKCVCTTNGSSVPLYPCYSRVTIQPLPPGKPTKGYPLIFSERYGQTGRGAYRHDEGNTRHGGFLDQLKTSPPAEYQNAIVQWQELLTVAVANDLVQGIVTSHVFREM